MSSPVTIPNRIESLKRDLVLAREQTDKLFDLIAPETLYARPIPERHRLIFYLGHFEAFDWNILARRSLGEPSFHRTFDALFERGIDPPPGEAPMDSPADWPTVAEVEEYRKKTRAWVDDHLADLDPLTLQMAIEHRHMHAETFAYLLHNLPCEQKQGPPADVFTSGRTPSNPMIAVSGGNATLGQQGDSFGWDNERMARDVFVPDFRISKFKISNGEYLDFVDAGGPVPHFWTHENSQWFFRGMFDVTPLPLDWPVWVTQQQAAAYARWRGTRLMSEAQFHRVAAFTAPDAARDNFDFRNWDPVPVNADPPGVYAPFQMTGNGWEWTRDIFAPFAGFEAHPLYPGYSADFFDGQHYVLKGASPRTAAVFTRPSFRNWFRLDYPYVYAGFRLVEN